MSSNPNPPPFPGSQPNPRSGPPPVPGQPSSSHTSGAAQRPTLSDTGSLALVPGARPLPEYELVQLIGQGGFGQVWKARGPGGFAIALKFILMTDHGGSVEMRSLELMREIRHPHLLTMFGAWQAHGYLIIAMELADQTTYDYLLACMKAGWPGTPPDKLLDFMRDAALGIDHLNSLGIQHRDIKPQNLLLVGGSVKVADFGLAKVMAHTNASHTGQQTLAYAAPEFFQGKVSPQSDQYSLAVTYCHLRANQLPFSGGMAEMLSGHLMRQPTLSYLPGQTERQVVARALSKNPQERWPTCMAFVQALQAALQQSGGQVPAGHAQTHGNFRPATAAMGSHTHPIVMEPPPLLDEAPRNRTMLYVLSIGLVITMVTLGLVVGFLIKPDPTQPTVVGEKEKEAAKSARELAAAHLIKKDYAKALAAYDDALKSNDKDVDALVGRARIKLLQEKYDAAIEDCTKALEINAKHAPALQTRADAHLEKIHLDLALTDAQQAVEQQAGFVEGLLTLARLHTQLTEFDQAIAACQKALDKAPKDAKCWAARAEVYLAREQFTPALDDFDKAIELDPKTPQYLVRRAQVKVLRDGPGAGKDDLTKAVALFQPVLARDYVERARVHYELAQYKEAQADCDRAVDRDPQGYEAFVVRADVFQAQGDRDKAIAERQKALGCLAQPATAPAFLARATLQEECGDYEKALADCSEAIKRAGRYAAAHAQRAGLYSAYRWDKQKAATDLDEALRLAPNRAELHYQRAIVYIDLDDPDQATKSLEKMQQLADGKYALSHARRATLYLHLGQHEQAVEAAKTAIDRSPRSLMALQARAVALTYLKRTPDAAVADLDRAIDLAPNDLDLRLDRAYVLRLNNQAEKAKRDLEEYQRRSPHGYLANLNFGRHHDGLSKWADATTAYTRALSIYPQGGEALLLRGRAFYEQNSNEKARQDYDAVLKQQPNLPAAYYQRGLLSLNLERYDDAIADFDQALTNHKGGKKKKAEYLNYQGRCLHEKGEPARAVEIYTQAMSYDPALPYPYNNRALSYAKLGKHDLALQDLEQALKLRGENALYHANFGYVYFEKKDYRLSAQYYGKAIDLERNPRQRASYYHYRGDAWYELFDYQAARDDYVQATQLDPTKASYFSSLGMSYSALKDWDRAGEAQGKAFDLAVSNSWKAYYVNRRGNTFFNRAEGLVKLNRADDARRDYDRAIDDYKEAARLDDTNAVYHGNLGYAYRMTKQESDCQTSYANAITREKDRSNKANYYYQHGLSLYRQEKFKDALEDFKNAVRSDPAPGVYYAYQGEAYYGLKEYRNAIDAYTEGIKRLTNLTDKAACYHYRGWCQHLLNDDTKALQDLDSSLQVDPKRAGAYSDRAVIYDALGRTEDAKRDRERAEELKKK